MFLTLPLHRALGKQLPKVDDLVWITKLNCHYLVLSYFYPLSIDCYNFLLFFSFTEVFDSPGAKEVPLETKESPSEHEVEQCQLMRHAKSESELWFERQRKQIRRKRRKLQLLDSLDAAHYCASWSSSSSSSSSSLADSSEHSSKPPHLAQEDTGKTIVGKEKNGQQNSSKRSEYNRLSSKHRRNTLSTVTSNMLLRSFTAAKENDEFFSRTAKTKQSDFLQSRCPCSRCSQVCHRPKLCTSLRPVWKVLNKPSTASAASSELCKSSETVNCGQSVIDKAVNGQTRLSGASALLAVSVNTSEDNSTEASTVIDVAERSSAHSLPKLMLHSNATLSPTKANADVNSFSPPSYSPVYESYEEKKNGSSTLPNHFKRAVGGRGSDSVSETAAPKSNYPVNKLTHSSSSTGSTNAGSVNVLVPRNYQINRNRATRLSNPRIHSMQGLTRAKIKTVKITLVVITCYVSGKRKKTN